MELHEYITKKENQIEELLRSSTFRNQYGQIFAKKMGGQFNATYQEHRIWGYATFLSSASSKILMNKESAIGEQALKVAAELFETLSLVSEEYDKEYARLLAALCYDLSGYQANARCLLQFSYELEEQGPLDKITNQLFHLVSLLMQNRLQSISLATRDTSNNGVFGEMESHWKSGILGFGNYQLFGSDSEYRNDLNVAKQYAIDCRDAILTSILSLLELKFQCSYERTTWTILDDMVKLQPEIWAPFLRLLSMNPYKDDRLVSIEHRVSQVELWKSQIAAIQKGLLQQNRGFVIQMPTSAGKTLIAELAILQQIGTRKKCLYIAPFRALVAEVEHTFSNYLSRLGYFVSSLSGSYEVDELDQFLIRQSDVLVTTPEKIDFLLRVNPELFTDVGLIVIDEGHVLGNLDSRSARFELLLTKMKRRFTPTGTRFLFISAVMPDSDSADFAAWLTADKDAKILSPKLYDETMWQPTRRLLGYFKWVGDNGRIEFKNYVQSPESGVNRIFIPNFIRVLQYETVSGKRVKKIKSQEFPDKSNKSETTAMLAYRYISEGSVLVFCSTVARTRGGGVYSVLRAFLSLIEILDQHFVEEMRFPVLEQSEALEAAMRWYGEDHLITKCIRRGVAPHFGDLAEEVRRAIEREYAEKKIKILVATHTLGQGVNLPIKTILVYSLDINPNPRNRQMVKVRDFWNIVGRAGRAGRETEGQVIFLTNNARDESLYEYYSNQNHAERVQSIFTVAMKLLRERRISQDNLEQLISFLAEPTLMSLLVEEVVDTPDQLLLDSFIGDTLFKIQSVEDDVNVVSRILLGRANQFWEVESIERKSVFASTGLCLSSCKKIEEVIRQEEELFKEMIELNLESTFRLVLKCLANCEEMQPKDALNGLDAFGNELLERFILAWISGSSLVELRRLWQEAVDIEHFDLMNVFIEDCLNYRFPWGITAVLFISSFVLGHDWDDFPPDLKTLPSRVKYGLSDQYALWLRGGGILSREACMRISESYGRNTNLQVFGNWFLDQTNDDFVEMGIKSHFLLKNIMSVSSRLIFRGPYNQQLQPFYRFQIKGITYDEERIDVAQKSKPGERLVLKRDPENVFDSFAIEVWKDDKQLGFVPRELAKFLSFQMDIMMREIDCTLISKRGTLLNAIVRL